MKSSPMAASTLGLISMVVVLLLSSLGWGQTWSRIVEGSPLSLTAVAPENIPRAGTFWSFQRTNTPPLPFNAFPHLPVYYLGYGTAYLVDDSSVDYVLIYKQRRDEQALRQLEWEAGLLSDAEYFALEGGPAMMMSSLMTSYAYGNGVYLVDMAATVTNGSAPVASFSIAGGTNLAPYDILRSTNVAARIADWNWIGIGYTSNRYTFSNQPPQQAFYLLAKPQNTLSLGWGDTAVGQCAVPPGVTNVLMVAGGAGQSVALRQDGTVVAWGKNDYGQGSAPTNLTGVTMIAAGYQHNVALLTNGAVMAWGLNAPGFYNLTNVPASATNVTVISAQALHSLALRNDGTLVAWGYNSSGENTIPTGLSNVVAIACGYQHNLAAKADGTVVAWGQNVWAQCTGPGNLSNVVDVAAGVAHSLALKRDGTVVAWGRNTYGETNVPAGLTNVVAIAAGGDPLNNSAYSVAIKNDNTLAIWGSGPVVTALAGMSNVIAIAGGADHALGVRTGPRTPVLTLLPANQFQIAGGNVTFAARGAGLYGVGYQWNTNGVNLAGATNATLTLTNVQAAQAGNYTVTVSNEVGTITSPNTALTLVTAPSILTQTPMPTNQEAIFHKYLTLAVDVTAPGATNGFPLTYQWKFNGTNVVGGNTNSYTLFGETNIVGDYTVTVTNAVGAASASWQVTLTYVGSYVAPGTLAYHLATNAVARTNGFTPANLVQLSGWTAVTNFPENLGFVTNAVWATNFWLAGVKGLSATAIAIRSNYAAQGTVTMVSPRHCLFAEHMHKTNDRFVAIFLDTNNVIYWRTNVETVFIANDLSVGLLNEDLPSAVGFLSVVPTNLSTYLPNNSISVVQGIGMNQSQRLFSSAYTFNLPAGVFWDYRRFIPFGLTTNWSIELSGGDSSGPERLLIGDQLILLTHHFGPFLGPNYSFNFNAINQQMHYLSTNNNVGTDYQLTPFSLTNWPSIH